MLKSIGAFVCVRLRGVVRFWEGPLREAPLYRHSASLYMRFLVMSWIVHLDLHVPKCSYNSHTHTHVLWEGQNGLRPAPDNLNLGCSYHLHSSHRFLSTWGASLCSLASFLVQKQGGVLGKGVICAHLKSVSTLLKSS